MDGGTNLFRVQFLLTDSEAIEALRSAQRAPDGRLIVEIPADRLAENAGSRPSLVFDDFARTVSIGGRQLVALEPKPYAVLKLVWQRGKASHEEISSEVWGERGASDSALRNAVNAVNNRLLDAGFPLTLDRSRRGISVELLG